MRPGTELVASKCLLSSQFSESPGVGPGMQLEPKKCVDLSPLLQESPGVGLGLGGQLLTHSLLPVPVMAPFCPQRHERQAQHRYQQQQRRRREEEERQRHAEHHARRERDASGREEARAEGSGLDPAAPEKTSAKAKGSGAGGHGPERPKRPGSLLAPIT